MPAVMAWYLRAVRPRSQLAAPLTALCCWARQVQPTAKNARNHSQCDSMLIGDTAGANTYPYIQARGFVPSVAHLLKATADRVHILKVSLHNCNCQVIVRVSPI